MHWRFLVWIQPWDFCPCWSMRDTYLPRQLWLLRPLMIQPELLITLSCVKTVCLPDMLAYWNWLNSFNFSDHLPHSLAMWHVRLWVYDYKFLFVLFSTFICTMKRDNTQDAGVVTDSAIFMTLNSPSHYLLESSRLEDIRTMWQKWQKSFLSPQASHFSHNADTSLVHTLKVHSVLSVALYHAVVLTALRIYSQSKNTNWKLKMIYLTLRFTNTGYV